MSANDTSQSYDVTRESLSGGTRSARAVIHQTSNSASPVPLSVTAGTISVTPAAYSATPPTPGFAMWLGAAVDRRL